VERGTQTVRHERRAWADARSVEHIDVHKSTPRVTIQVLAALDSWHAV
jgi:hypothetical protein